jgi:hypothetical protein
VKLHRTPLVHDVVVVVVHEVVEAVVAAEVVIVVVVVVVAAGVVLYSGWRTLREFSDFRDFCFHFREK